MTISPAKTEGTIFEIMTNAAKGPRAESPITQSNANQADIPEPRSLSCKSQGEITRFGDITVDFSRAEAYKDQSQIMLTAHELKVLKYFIDNPSRVISRDEFLNQVWGYNAYPTTRTVDNQILKLRQKLESDPQKPTYFLTVHGMGYKFASKDTRSLTRSSGDEILSRRQMNRSLSQGAEDHAAAQSIILGCLSVVCDFLAANYLTNSIPDVKRLDALRRDYIKYANHAWARHCHCRPGKEKGGIAGRHSQGLRLPTYKRKRSRLPGL